MKFPANKFLPKLQLTLNCGCNLISRRIEKKISNISEKSEANKYKEQAWFTSKKKEKLTHRSCYTVIILP